MCTLSIITGHEDAGGTSQSRAKFVLAFNRDEQRSRAQGEPLELVSYNGRHAVHPRDPDGGGTWIAANDAGLAFAILNRNEPGIPNGSDRGMSRGLLIPRLLDASDLDTVAGRAAIIAREITRGFRLVVTDGVRIVEFVGGDREGRIEYRALSEPFMRASSGLGDDVVREPRNALFELMVVHTPPKSRETAQASFHSHAWPDRRHLSVRMDREEARSVSQTTITVTPTRVDIAHALRAGEHVDDDFAPRSMHSLARGIA